jgi:transcriptional regulator with XRE-family HTH domain
MAKNDVRAIGQRIRKYRLEKGMSASKLAERAGISKSYLSELETGSGNHKRPSAETLYRIGKALGIAMSDLLGVPFITSPASETPPGLAEFARSRKLPESDVRMLSTIRFRGEVPRSAERWAFIYDAIKNSAAMDPRQSSRRARGSCAFAGRVAPLVSAAR